MNIIIIIAFIAVLIAYIYVLPWKHCILVFESPIKKTIDFGAN